MRRAVIREIDRAAPELIAGLGALGVATVHEAQGRAGLMKPYMRPVFPGAAIAGSAVTVLAHPNDNLMVHVSVEMCRPGDVLLVALSSDCTDSMLGDLIATSLQARGVIGAVIDAGCRDVPVLRQMNFPVWSRAVSARGITKEKLGSVNLPVVCAGVPVNPGDVVVADDDGVVIVPRQTAPSVLAAGAAREAGEAETRRRLEAGELKLDMEDMRPMLAARGLEYFDRAEDMPPEDV